MHLQMTKDTFPAVGKQSYIYLIYILLISCLYLTHLTYLTEVPRARENVVVYLGLASWDKIYKITKMIKSTRDLVLKCSELEKVSLCTSDWLPGN